MSDDCPNCAALRAENIKLRGWINDAEQAAGREQRRAERAEAEIAACSMALNHSDVVSWPVAVTAQRVMAENEKLRECVNAAQEMYSYADHTGGEPNCNACAAADRFLSALAAIDAARDGK